MATAASVDVHSPLTGSVNLVYVENGARVAAGDRLVEVECMKTLWPVDAPADGIVSLHVSPGEVVGENQLIATIDPLPDQP